MFKYDVISDLDWVATAKNVYNRNFIVILLLLNELSSNLIQQFKIRRLFIVASKKLPFFVIYYKADNFYSVFGHFYVKHVLEIGLPWQQRRPLVA